MTNPGPACTIPILRLPFFAMNTPSVPATTNPATMRMYAIARKWPCLAKSRIEIPVASCRIAMSVIYDLSSGVSCCFGIEIPNVLLNAIGSRSACAPVKTVAVAKMSEIPLKSMKRLDADVDIMRAFPWVERGSVEMCQSSSKAREQAHPHIIPHTNQRVPSVLGFRFGVMSCYRPSRRNRN